LDYWDGLQKLGQFPPSHYYQKAANVETIPSEKLDEIVRKLCACAETCPVTNMGSGIILMPLGGELATMTSDQLPTADVFSRMKWWFIVITEFPQGKGNPGLRQRCIEWVREVHSIVEPYGAQDDGRAKDYWYDCLGDIYGSNLPRLVELKKKYDPANVFSLNRNILPNT
jgi:hypothetical protein